MQSRLFDRIGAEPSQRTGFSGNLIDRNAEHRTDGDVERALSHRQVRIMLVHDGRVYLKAKPANFLADHSVAEARRLGANLDEAVLLGHDQGDPVLIAEASALPHTLPETIKAIEFRSVYTQGLLAPDRLGALAQGASLLNWNAANRFCGRCGGATRMHDGGYRRCCTLCEASHFPRTDPVVIMLAIDGDSCLLGRNPHFQPGMYSCLAGFLEPGETIEAAVRRETREEAGIRIGRVVYHASQPWPFPHTLMIGCYGEALTRDLAIDYKELEDCRWFSREEVRAILAGRKEGLSFPPRAAIATLLIEDWAMP